ncbi:MAG TPA: LCP family protein [Acidimicrobiales bacterium]|nr:LCP family protein [Acidimicrobiales bacterium]
MRLRRVIVAVDVLLAVVAVAMLSLRPVPAHGQAPPAFVVHKVDTASWWPRSANDPYFLLVVGNDGRAGLEGVRGDAIHLIGVNPGAKAATILNIPRDTWVDIPGHGREKITSSFDFGGLPLEVQTVSQLTGVPISFAVTTNFDGFMALVDAMGGFNIEIPSRMYDPFSGADFQPGPFWMNGTAALSFARDRHLDGGDLTRTTNQGWLLLSALQRAEDVTKSPFGTLKLLSLISRYTQLDNVGIRDLYPLVNGALELDTANVRNVTMPATLGFVGPAAVVFVGPGAGDLFADFRDDAVLQSH